GDHRKTRGDRNDDHRDERETPRGISRAGVDAREEPQRKPGNDRDRSALPKAVEQNRDDNAREIGKKLDRERHYGFSSYRSMSERRRVSSSSVGRSFSIKRSANAPALLPKNFVMTCLIADCAAASRATRG